MAQNLVGRTEAAGGLDLPVGQIGGKIYQIVVEAGQDLLAVGMTNRNRPDAGTDHPQSCLMQVNCHRLF
jgi:hypothetical protein